MKKFSLLMTFLFLLSPLAARAEIKVGLINIQRILRDVNDGKSVMKQLEAKFKVKQKELKSDEAKIKKAQEDYKKQSLVLSDAAKRNKEREIQKMVFELQGKTVKYQKEINQLEQKMKKPIIDKVQKVVLEISKKAGVDLTFEISTSPVLYAKTRVDLTEDVIKAYNKKKKK